VAVLVAEVDQAEPADVLLGFDVEGARLEVAVARNVHAAGAAEIKRLCSCHHWRCDQRRDGNHDLGHGEFHRSPA
jgi:hypothetical protein